MGSGGIHSRPQIWLHHAPPPIFCAFWGFFLLAPPPPPPGASYGGCLCLPTTRFGAPPGVCQTSGGGKGRGGGCGDPTAPASGGITEGPAMGWPWWWRGGGDTHIHPAGTCLSPLRGGSAPRAPPSLLGMLLGAPASHPCPHRGAGTARVPMSPPALCRGWWPLSPESDGFRLPEGDMGTMSPKSSSPQSRVTAGHLGT